MFLEAGVCGAPTHSPFAFRRKAKGEIFRDALKRKIKQENFYFATSSLEMM